MLTTGCQIGGKHFFGTFAQAAIDAEKPADIGPAVLDTRETGVAI